MGFAIIAKLSIITNSGITLLFTGIFTRIE